MPKYEVAITYKGQRNFIVEADSTDEASEMAEEKFKNGEDGVMLGNEYEDVENVVARPL